MSEKEGSKNIRVVLKDVRLSFSDALWKAKRFKDQADSKPRFSSAFLIDPKTESGKANIAAVRTAQREVAQAKWPKGIPNDVKGDRIPLRDGNEKDYDGYAGMFYVAAAAPENRRPQVVDRRRRPLVEADGKPYAGCYVNAVLNIWADTRYGNRVCATLEVVQFVRDGEAFGAAPVDIDSVLDDLGDDTDGIGAFEEEPGASSVDASSLL